MEHILFRSTPSLNATVTKSSQVDSEKVALASVHPENILWDELQYIKDLFLSNPTAATTIIEPSQSDCEEAAPTYVQLEYVLLSFEEPILPDTLPLVPTLTNGATHSTFSG